MLNLKHCIKYEIWKLFLSYADAVITGNDVLVERNGESFPEKVTEVSTFTMEGIFCIMH